MTTGRINQVSWNLLRHSEAPKVLPWALPFDRGCQPERISTGLVFTVPSRYQSPLRGTNELVNPSVEHVHCTPAALPKYLSTGTRPWRCYQDSFRAAWQSLFCDHCKHQHRGRYL